MAVKENITRRRVMAGLAVASAPAVPLVALAGTVRMEGVSLQPTPPSAPSPLRALYHRWQATKDEFNAEAFAGNEEADDLLFQEMLRLEQVAADFVPQTLEDFAFKIIFADDNGNMTMNIHQEALVRGACAMVGIRRRIPIGSFGLGFEDEKTGGAV